MFNSDQQPSESLQKRLRKDQALLEAIKDKLPDLERLLSPFACDYEDGIYRFYHQSSKVYNLQDYTTRATELFKSIAQTTNGRLCSWYEEIVSQGTGADFEMDHNRDWTLHTRPIVEAFFHAKYFVEMMLKYGHELKLAPSSLPSGWAAILELTINVNSPGQHDGPLSSVSSRIG